MAGEFDKDFGYLMPFLDKVAGAAASLADPAARAELTKLVADEKARWARIRQVVTQATVSNNNALPQAAASPEAREPLSFTVGSLRPKRT